MAFSNHPKIVLLFSGKRKSGKDFVTDLLSNKLDSDKTVIIKISAPIKSFWAKFQNLELTDLMSSSAYKEQHRREMINWSEEQRRKDPAIFCRQAVDLYEAHQKPIWIVSDVRRKTDIDWFKQMYSNAVKTIRIDASDETRKKRGWIFTSGVDDQTSECGLDDFKDWDWRVLNDDDNKPEDLDLFIKNILNSVDDVLKRS